MLKEQFRKKIEKYWGRESWDAFKLISLYLVGSGFREPNSLSEPHSISYHHDPYQALRISFTVSSFSIDEKGNAKFDASLGFWSKTLYDTAIDTDAWYSYKYSRFKQDKWLQNFVPCLNVDLSYLKWVQIEGKNPFWVMTYAGANELIHDVNEFFLPIIKSIKTDEDLSKLMGNFLKEERPRWVLSDKPGNRRNLAEMINALNR